MPLNTSPSFMGKIGGRLKKAGSNFKKNIPGAINAIGSSPYGGMMSGASQLSGGMLNKRPGMPGFKPKLPSTNPTAGMPPMQAPGIGGGGSIGGGGMVRPPSFPIPGGGGGGGNFMPMPIGGFGGFNQMPTGGIEPTPFGEGGGQGISDLWSNYRNLNQQRPGGMGQMFY